MHRREFLKAAALLPMPALVRAQAWPLQPIKVIAPDQAGSGNDAVIRLFAPRLEAALGQPIVVDNRPGAGGRIGVEQAFRAPPDGHTFMLGNAGATGINAAVYSNLPYDIEKDFTPISLLAAGPNVLVVTPSLPVKTVPELVAHLKANPGKTNFAMTGKGGTAHMLTELFRLRTGTDFVTVPYRGAPEMATAIMTGEAHANFNNLINIQPQIAAGQAKLIAVTTAERSPLAPGALTMAEQGFTGFDASAWTALFGLKGTPPAALQRMQSAIAALREDTSLRDRLRVLGGDLIASGPDVLAARVSRDIATWRDLVKQAGLRFD
ncbi:MAG: tripartite tricarboxylate transporter substrate binding protein [Methylobacterium sp.]|jgi:tripartite-type tricarboxylate transporter receptor subunit TctC|nr:tripartite tricarboxylate transporter substrate binding protein [Methylobacterium sp.]MCA3619198.1 tripartite tricarboxylate transporter substrate binding protein [Methylobacterium sp.]MCA3622512.1 tripartite tricarboxylate transporter substrate binding protein [Methylobacterium sp.]